MAQAAAAIEARSLHTPVMVDTCLNLLAPAISAPGSVLIDCTLGMGGHSEAALERFPELHVIGIDRDTDAIARAGKRLERFGQRFTAVHATYDHVADITGDIDGVLMDLGVSSYQLDVPERGFSYAHDAPLDMRMDTSRGCTAAQLLANADEREIARILRVYGEEKFASRIARAIVQQRNATPVTTSRQLVDIVRATIPAPARRTGGNPAKRTFQALRIAVNNELSILEAAIPAALSALRVGGRIVVEAYHSLEDRLIKEAFAAGARSRTPAGVPIELAGHEPYLKLLTKGALKASEQEIQNNPRAQSVRIRAAEKVRPLSQELSAVSPAFPNPRHGEAFRQGTPCHRRHEKHVISHRRQREGENL